MKILFISSRDVYHKSHGGFQCTNRNYLSFCKLLGTGNVKVINLGIKGKKSIFRSIFKRIILVFGFFWGLSPGKLQNIIKSSKEYDFIFIDQSYYGVIAYYLKRKNYEGKIICFFHNVEYKIRRQKAKINFRSFFDLIIAYYNEKKAFKYSDIIVTLNQRDSTELFRIYGIRNVNVIPISLSDTVKDHRKVLTSIPPTLLFIGNHWYANIHGLKWFVNNILDQVNIKLQIVGTGMDVLREKFVHPKIEFLGYVSDLHPILMDADYVIVPIFIGSGMKVKTCEALMYGKNIIGTKEAFEGYEVDFKKVGAVCNTKEEFIDTINHYGSTKRAKFNEYSRACFLEKYSFQATLNKFDNLLSR